jgi:hypothetical protein
LTKDKGVAENKKNDETVPNNRMAAMRLNRTNILKETRPRIVKYGSYSTVVGNPEQPKGQAADSGKPR